MCESILEKWDKKMINIYIAIIKYDYLIRKTSSLKNKNKSKNNAIDKP